jgi:hypothetical protein
MGREVDASGREMCGDFRRGQCQRGRGCKFSHGESDERWGAAVKKAAVDKAAKQASTLAAEAWMKEQVDVICFKYALDDAMKRRLLTALSSRLDDVREIVGALDEMLADARNPPGLMSVKRPARKGSPSGSRSPDKKAIAKNKNKKEDRSKSRKKDRSKSRKQDLSKNKNKARSKSRNKKDRSKSRNKKEELSKSQKKDRSKSRNRKDGSKSRKKEVVKKKDTKKSSEERRPERSKSRKKNKKRKSSSSSSS